MIIPRNAVSGVGLVLFAVLGLALTRLVPSHGVPLGVYAYPPQVLPLRSIMQVMLSLALTPASLFIIISKDYGPKDKHWAYATIGTVVGFWLKG
jgi:hypothetical protein